MPSTVATLSIGSELLLGQIVDTNAAHIARTLAAHGWRMGETRAVDDTPDTITRTIRELASLHAALIITGGLGPTKDDLTRQALAAAAGVGLREHAELIEQIAARFRAFNRPMTDVNRVQALLPEGAGAIFNPRGTAPGIDMRLGACRIFAMPGVPREMEGMLCDHVLPALGTGPDGVIRIRNLHCTGIGEGALGDMIADLMQRGRNPDVGTRVKDSIVTVRIVAQAPAAEEAERLLRCDEEAVRERLGTAIFGAEEETLASACVTALAARGQTLALAESCTGGLVAVMLTEVPGSSEVFIESAVTYANAAKVRRLGIPEALLAQHGAVSAPVARAMAEGIRAASGADYGIGITGIAGPGGGTEAKPVGLVHVALATPEGTRHEECRFLADRQGNRWRAANHALTILLKTLRA